MKRARIILLLYGQLLLLVLFFAVLISGQLAAVIIPFLLLAPVLLYLSGAIVGQTFSAKQNNLPTYHFLFSRLLRAYSTIITIFLLTSTLFLMKSIRELFLGLLVLPLPVYFLLETFWFSSRPRPLRPTLRKRTIPVKKKTPVPLDGELITEEQYRRDRPKDLEATAEDLPGVSDVDRRQFLKLLGGGSVGMIALLMLNPHKASAAFFGSVPGPGTVGLKNSSGTLIDPKEKSPTDGYTIAEVDDSGVDSYYGFTNKDGAWYISKEGSDGSYRYFKGNTGFAANWDNKENLSYNYFDNIF